MLALRNALQIASLALFTSFLALGFRVARARGEVRRRVINQFLIFILVVYAAIGLTQKDAWPFSTYPMMAHVMVDRAAMHSMLMARAVDATGREWPVDSLAWSPLFPASTLAWFDAGYAQATPAERDAAMDFLLARAEDARRARAGGERYIGNRALLGPLAAPDTNLYWNALPAPTPFRALRIYRVSWNPSQFAADPNRTARQLLCEFRR